LELAVAAVQTAVAHQAKRILVTGSRFVVIGDSPSSLRPVLSGRHVSCVPMSGLFQSFTISLSIDLLMPSPDCSPYALWRDDRRPVGRHLAIWPGGCGRGQTGYRETASSLVILLRRGRPQGITESPRLTKRFGQLFKVTPTPPHRSLPRLCSIRSKSHYAPWSDCNRPEDDSGNEPGMYG
jgi:hypothetical protein